MHGRTQQLALAWQGTSPAAAQSSYDGALKAEETAAADCAKLRRLLLQRGRMGATDAEVERIFNWPANVSTARRNDLVNRGLVVVRYPEPRRLSVKSTIKVTVWIASEYGRPF